MPPWDITILSKMIKILKTWQYQIVLEILYNFTVTLIINASVSYRVGNIFTIWSNIIPIENVPSRNEKVCSHKNQCMSVQRSFLCNSHKLQIIQMSFNGWKEQSHHDTLIQWNSTQQYKGIHYSYTPLLDGFQSI